MLRVLVCQHEMIGLRYAARLAGVHPHSAELVLAKMVEEKLVKCRRSSSSKMYELNRAHDAVPILDAVFSAASLVAIKEKSKSLQGRGRSLLPFINEAGQMLACSRKDPNVA